MLTRQQELLLSLLPLILLHSTTVYSASYSKPFLYTLTTSCNYTETTYIVIGVATYLKVGGPHIRGSGATELGRVWEGFPLTLCGKYFIFKNPEVILTHTKAKAVLLKVWQLIN